jgi:hypothetical protein
MSAGYTLRVGVSSRGYIGDNPPDSPLGLACEMTADNPRMSSALTPTGSTRRWTRLRACHAQRLPTICPLLRRARHRGPGLADVVIAGVRSGTVQEQVIGCVAPRGRVSLPGRAVATAGHAAGGSPASEQLGRGRSGPMICSMPYVARSPPEFQESVIRPPSAFLLGSAETRTVRGASLMVVAATR